MKKTLAVLFAATIAVVVACTSPTAPQPEPQRDVANVSTPNPVAGAVAPTPTAVQPDDPTEGSIVKIDEQGNVTIYAPRVWGACV